MMNISEFFWEKVGIIAIASIIGAVYGLIISPIIHYLFPQITVIQVVKVFSLVFIFISLLSGDFLINSILGLIYTIAGFFTGLTASEGGGVLCSEETVKDIFSGSRSSLVFALLGVLCGALTIFLYR